MSYAICRMQKMKSHDLKGMQFHNQRERESKTNPDIDKAKEELNYDLVNDEKIDYNKKVKHIIESQKTSDRKTRKDAVLVNELVVTSDRDFFDNLPEEKQKQFFEESFDLFAERYGKQNIAYATVHNDEKTPHLHMGVVPMRDGKLQGKNIFNQKELRWMQDEFPKHLKTKGFVLERGEKGSDREHLTTQKFKAETLKQEIKYLESDLKDVQQVKSNLLEITSENEEKRSIGSKIGFKGKESVVMPKENYEKLYSLAQTSIEHAKNDDKSKRELEDVKAKNTQLETQLAHSRAKSKALSEENKLLRKTIAGVKELFKDKVKGFSKTVGYCKSVAVDMLKPKHKIREDFILKDELEGKKEYLQHRTEKLKKAKEKKKENTKGLSL